MKVKTFETFRCDAGWRTFSFLKIATDDGIVGWSEYNESFGSPGLSAVIEALMALMGLGVVLASRMQPECKFEFSAAPAAQPSQQAGA